MKPCPDCDRLTARAREAEQEGDEAHDALEAMIKQRNVF